MKNNQANKLKKFLKDHKQAVEEFVVVMGVEAKNHFVRNFNRQGFLDEAVDPWQKRKNKRGSGRGILIKTGDLKRSIRIIRKSRNGVTIGSDLPYAKIHNEGGSISKSARNATLNFKIKSNGSSRFAKAKNANFQQDVHIGKHTIRMPKRQFIGHSGQLTRKLALMLRAEIRKVFNR
ncbi:MAG: phage virion morphosis family protein [Bacteroidetes bacterium]|jgi:phage gpG-like protein|nr:phage virion morphosis family protein [Bacteroidota bacterium]